MELEFARMNHGKMLNELKAMNRGESHGGADLSDVEDNGPHAFRRSISRAHSEEPLVLLKQPAKSHRVQGLKEKTNSPATNKM